MAETNKEKVIIILVISTLALLIFNIGSCANAYNQNAGRKKEMFQRMDLEEKMSKFTQEKAILVEKLKAKEKELDEERASLQAAGKALTQEQLVNKSLTEELQKATKFKEVKKP